MLLAAMLAMVLVAAAPALAQATVNSDDDTDNSNVQYCTQVQAALANQSNYGDANAAADDGEAVAVVAQELGISQEAVQNCIQGEGNGVVGATGDVGTDGTDGTDGGVVVADNNGVDDNGDGVVDETGEVAAVVVADSNGVDDNGDGVVDEAGEVAAASSSAAADGSSAAAGTSVLPDTGGASLFTLGAGALLVGGGLLARRIFS